LGYVLAIAANRRVPTHAGAIRADRPPAQLPKHAWQIHCAGAGAHGPRIYSWAWIALIQESIAGSQYTATYYIETLMLEDLIPSVGTVGDALDNVLCETTIRLYKTECTREGSPFRSGPIRTLADLENITSAWVSWYDEHRLMHRLGRRPRAEGEADYYARPHAGKRTGHT
jgi:transposase InsO family protein